MQRRFWSAACALAEALAESNNLFKLRTHLANVTISAIGTPEVLATDRTGDMLFAADFMNEKSCIIFKVEIAGNAIVVTSDFVMLQLPLGLESSETTFVGA